MQKHSGDRTRQQEKKFIKGQQDAPPTSLKASIRTSLGIVYVVEKEKGHTQIQVPLSQKDGTIGVLLEWLRREGPASIVKEESRGKETYFDASIPLREVVNLLIERYDGKAL